MRDPRETEDGRQGIIAHPQPNLIKVKVGLGRGGVEVEVGIGWGSAIQ